MVRDSGNVSTLTEALHWAVIDYPSDHIAIIIWDCGSGTLHRNEPEIESRGICYDGDTGLYWTENNPNWLNFLESFLP